MLEPACGSHRCWAETLKPDSPSFVCEHAQTLSSSWQTVRVHGSRSTAFYCHGGDTSRHTSHPKFSHMAAQILLVTLSDILNGQKWANAKPKQRPFQLYELQNDATVVLSCLEMLNISSNFHRKQQKTKILSIEVNWLHNLSERIANGNMSVELLSHHSTLIRW